MTTLSGEVAAGSQVVDVTVDPRIARVVGPATALSKMTGIGTEPVSLAGRAATFTATTTVLPDAPGVRVREGQHHLLDQGDPPGLADPADQGSQSVEPAPVK